MIFLSSEDINKLLDFPSVIEALESGFRQDYQVPVRMHINYENQTNSASNTLLLMPAIQLNNLAGVKIVNVAPGNGKRDLSSIQGIYYLLDAVSGVPLGIFDAQSITNWRTAAASALASRFLSKENATTHLMIGTGSLAPYVIAAHREVRPLKRLMIYGRTASKAKALAIKQQDHYEEVTVVTDLPRGIEEADIISTATLSAAPLVLGKWLKPGQHLDLIGAFRPDMREVDDEAIIRSQVFVDNLEKAPEEAGDLAIPIQKGIFQHAQIQADLFQLCRLEKEGRTNDDEITLFKSVGHALEDLVTAQLIMGRN